MRSRAFLALLAGAALAAAGYARLPYAITHANWVFIVAQNWQEQGFWASRGQLDITPGGAAGGAEPHAYQGHRPAFMYTTRLPVWLAGDVHRGMLLHSALLGALTVAAARRALGARRGTWVGWAWALSPGIARLLVPEPIGTPMAWGGALLLALWPDLRADALPRTAAGRGLLYIALPLWIQMNWTTVFLLAPFLLALLVAAPRGALPRRLALCALLSAALLPVALASMQSKLSGAVPGGTRLADFLGSYGFSAAGYGLANPVSWPTALVRIGAAIAVGLAPLLAVATAQLRAHRGRALAAALAVPAASLALALLFRNYFAEHPWMACPQLGAAVLLGLAAAGEAAPSPAAPRRAWTSALALAAGLGWLAFGLQLFAVQMDGMSRLARLVHQHTPRGAAVWLDPALAADPHFHNPLETALDFDRAIRIAAPGEEPAGQGFLLARTPDPTRAGALVAQSEPAAHPPLARALAWYRLHLGRRRAGDAVELDDASYLYRLP